MSEAAFFSIYGNVFSLYVADKQAARPERVAEPRELPFVQEALRSIGEGGYPEALARVACLLARKGEPLLLSRLSAKQEVLADYKDLLPDMPPDQWRRVRGEQEIIVRYAPGRGARDAAGAAARRGRSRAPRHARAAPARRRARATRAADERSARDDRAARQDARGHAAQGAAQGPAQASQARRKTARR